MEDKQPQKPGPGPQGKPPVRTAVPARPKPPLRGGPPVQPRAIVHPNVFKDLVSRIVQVEARLQGVVSQAITQAELKLREAVEDEEFLDRVASRSQGRKTDDDEAGTVADRVAALEESLSALTATIERRDLASESLREAPPSSDGTPSSGVTAAFEERLSALETSVQSPGARESAGSPVDVAALEARMGQLAARLEEVAAAVGQVEGRPAGATPSEATAEVAAAASDEAPEAASDATGATAEPATPTSVEAPAEAEPVAEKVAEAPAPAPAEPKADVAPPPERAPETTGPSAAEVIAQANAEATAALVDRVATLENRADDVLKAMEEWSSWLNSRLTELATPPADGGEAVRALEQRVATHEAALQTRLASLDVPRLRDRILEDVRSALAERPPSDPNEKRLAALEERLTTIEERAWDATAPAPGATGAHAPAPDLAKITEQVTQAVLARVMEAVDARLAALDLEGLQERVPERARASLGERPERPAVAAVRTTERGGPGSASHDVRGGGPGYDDDFERFRQERQRAARTSGRRAAGGEERPSGSGETT